MSDNMETVWQSLISCIQETSASNDDIYVSLKQSPVPDEFSRRRDFRSCAGGFVKECAPCPLDNLDLYIRAGRDGRISQHNFGIAERILDPDSASVQYDPGSLREIRREVGVRLLRLSEIGRDVYFTGSLLGYESAKVDEGVLDGLLGTGRSRNLGFVRIDTLKKIRPDSG